MSSPPNALRAAEPPLPGNEQEIAAGAARIGLRIPAGCMPGVIDNLALLGRHAAILRARGGKPE